MGFLVGFLEVHPLRAAVVQAARLWAAAPPTTGGSHQRASAPLDADFDKAAVFHITIPAVSRNGEAEFGGRCPGRASAGAAVQRAADGGPRERHGDPAARCPSG
ncbi:hypothetical protein GCM10009654_19210 [Streptomyces hebeiensis]|uniref:Uncharacterized protein n=1 Tax=Streptomyces hebeiensis TaxID=229486 RepID=A0ABN1UQI9_9ACTN